MGEAIVLLSSPRAGFDVVDAADIFAPSGLPSHLVEFAVLDHHSMHYAEEALIRGEEAGPSSQGVTLKEALVTSDEGSQSTWVKLTCILCSLGSRALVTDVL